MSMRKDSYINKLSFGCENKTKINGLETFIKSLEKDFFSEVNISNCSTDNTDANLVIEIECKFDLNETLYHLKKGVWGNIHKNHSSTQIKSSFSKALSNLKQQNSLRLDIEEISIFLNDTSIIIHKIYEQSIAEQLENILIEIANNYPCFSKGLSEDPFEIYVPVFQEELLQNNTTISNMHTITNNANDYFCFWGLYFDSEEEAVIYHLQDKTIVTGDLFMLNQ